MFILERERVHRRVGRGGGRQTGRGGERENLKQILCGTEPDPEVGLDLATLRSQPEPKPRVRCLTD